MEHELFQVLEQAPSRPVDHAFRDPGGPRGVEDVERVVEGELLEIEVWYLIAQAWVPAHSAYTWYCCLFIPPGDPLFPFMVPILPCFCHELVVVHSTADASDVRPVPIQKRDVGNDHHLLDGREHLEDLHHPPKGIKGLPVVEVPISGEEHLRSDLSKTIKDILESEIRGAGGPDGPDACGSKECHDGLDHVGHEPDDSVTCYHSHVPEGAGDTGDLIMQFPVGEGPWGDGRVLALENEGWPIVAVSQEVLSIVQPGAGEPLRTQHVLAVLKDCIARSGVDDIEEFPE